MKKNEDFREYVTSTAFHLSLSRGMCATLIAIRDGGTRPWHGYSMFIPTVRSLERRGLVIHHPGGVKLGGQKIHFTLTEPGKLVAKLVEMAGLADSQKSSKKAAA